VKLVIALLLATSAALAQPPAPAAPDTLFIHGNILTGAHLKPSDTSPIAARVTAIAVTDGTITAIGSDAEILKLKSPKTKVVDLHGAFAMPGFNDAHTHMGNAGRQQLAIDLTGVHSLAEMQQRIRNFATTAPAGTWLLGGGWDHTLWPGAKLPTRIDIDAVTTGHPAIFRRVDEHMAIANSAALAAAGISAVTPDPPGAKIDRDGSGNPTGLLRETAATNLVFTKVPPPTPQQREQALTVAMQDALAHGVTSVQDNSDWEDFLAWETLERTGKLHLRVAEWLEFNQPLAVLEGRRSSHPADDPFLHITMLKGFMDGSLGSRTAALAKPYTDDPGNSGIPRYDQKNLNSMTVDRAAAGFQIGFHAIGDQANNMALTAFTGWMSKIHAPCPPQPHTKLPTSARPTDPCGVPYPSPRLRIEHAQVLLPADFDRFAQLSVIASMQPSHLLTDMNWAAARLGPERVKYSYAWRSMLDHHIPLAFGTDYPVESINPFRGLYAAITRQNEAGTATYQPQERISLPEAIYAYTQTSAFAEFREHVKGRLEPGFLADFIVLDRDITTPTSTPQQLLHTRVLRTIVNGETVYTAP
jgi:predicted amidohydrolase YtcJ